MIMSLDVRRFVDAIVRVVVTIEILVGYETFNPYIPIVYLPPEILQNYPEILYRKMND